MVPYPYSGQMNEHRPLKLLLIESSLKDATYVKRVLLGKMERHITVNWVPTLKSAKDAFTSQEFDLVIVDINLPDSHGIETVSALRLTIGDRIPIIALCDDANMSVKDIAALEGRIDCLAKKDVKVELLPHLLNRLCIGQQAQSSLLRLISTNPDSMVVVNGEGIVLFANFAAQKLFHKSSDELLFHEFGVPVVASGTTEVDIGGNRVAEMRIVEINWQQQDAWLTTLRDITERKCLEDNLKAAKIEAELGSRAKSQFISCMSHELRTPLNSVIGFSELIQFEYADEDEPLAHEYAGLILRSGLHLLSMVNEILDASSAEGGSLKLECQLFDLSKSITSTLEMLNSQAREKDVRLVYEAQPIMIPLYADIRRVRQILINVINNGIKYTPSGGAVTLSFSLSEKGSLSVVVADNGIGIDPNYLHQLMTPFGRGGDAYTSRQEGTGLGLFITKSLMELHGGEVIVDSVLGSGTKVTLIFPPERIIPYNGTPMAGNL